MSKMLTKGSVLLSLLFLGFLVIGVHHESFAEETQGLQKVALKIEGVTCGSCIPKIQAALSKVSGVKTASVQGKKKWLFFTDESDVRATVEFEASKTNVQELIQAVASAGSAMDEYKATLIE